MIRRGLAQGLLLLLAACAASTPPAPVWHPLPAGELSRPLTLPECIALARRSDVRAGTWAAKRATAAAALRVARAYPDPTAMFEWEGLGLFGARPDVTLKATVGYPLFAWWSRPHKILGARAERDAAEAEIREDRRKLAAEVATAWYGLVADQRRERLAARLVGTAREALSWTKANREAGERSTFDVTRAEGEVLQAEADLEEARAKTREDQLSLAFSLGADRPAFPTAREPEEPAPGGAPAAAAGEIPEPILAAALAQDPAWAGALARVGAAEAALHVTQTSAPPLGGLAGAIGRAGPTGRPTGTVTLEAPIPFSDTSRADRAKDEAALASARVEAERVRRETIRSLSVAWEQVRAAEARLVGSARPLTARLSEIAVRAREMYKAGEIEHAEVTTAERDARAAERSEIDAWRDARTARFTLEAATGLHDGATGPCR